MLKNVAGSTVIVTTGGVTVTLTVEAVSLWVTSAPVAVTVLILVVEAVTVTAGTLVLRKALQKEDASAGRVLGIAALKAWRQGFSMQAGGAWGSAKACTPTERPHTAEKSVLEIILNKGIERMEAVG